MAWSKFKTRAVIGVIVLIVVILFLITMGVGDSLGRGRLRLPVGNGTPAISLGERHGLILASDGSLWSWGADFLGWPVLGLGPTQLKSTTLHRVGQETNWVSICASASRNLALKSDGTLWAWGESVQGQGSPLKTIFTPAPAAPGNDWKQAVLGGNTSVALKPDGTLWGWGNNWAGAAGIPSTNGSSLPVQIGVSTNWIRVWAGILETVGLQADGTLWYWGENPNPAIAQKAGQIFAPLRISPDTNWADVGFGVNTVFAIKADGTLWTWGRNAHAYTSARDANQDDTPVRIGTDADWKSFTSTTGWWCNGLLKKDGSLWLMDASLGQPNGPRPPFQPVKFRKIEFAKEYAACAAGAVHGAPPGVHGPIGVMLMPDGEVRTWGMVLGDPPTLKLRLQTMGLRIIRIFRPNLPADPNPEPIYRSEPWQLRND